MIQIELSNQGAELQSLKYKGKEYLWQGDPLYWGRSAPILFPIVGRLANDTLRIDGNEYIMKQHGFARDTEFVHTQINAASDVLHMSHEPKEKYPYCFDLSVSYAQQANTLEVNWEIKNRDNKTMYFQIGAHPAFLLPEYDAKDAIHGYIMCYDANDNVVSPMLFSTLVNGLRAHYSQPKTLLNNKGILALTDTTFADDAILLEAQQVAKVALFDKQGKRVLTVSCQQADAFGLWAPNKPGCPFVCIEPWCGIADNAEFKGDISERDCIHSLEPGKRFEFCYSITLNS